MQVNLRVRRSLLISLIFLLVSSLAFTALPKPQGFVSDYADVISSSQEQEIEAVAKALADSGNIELAVVTVESMDGEAIEEYSYALAQSWGIGDSEDDTGLLFLLALEERQVRIEVGYGLEGDLPDGLIGRILDGYVLPPFKEGDYSEGMAEGTKAIAATLADKRDFTLQISNIDSYAASENDSESFEDIIGTIFSILFVIFMIFGRLRLWPLLFLGSTRRGPYHGGGFGSSGRGGGFGGGGFGGFSGGGFGGGGASRGF